MKVAICYSGLYREFPYDWKKNHNVLTKLADNVYYSTWNNHPLPPIEEEIKLFDEPIIHYNPFRCKKFIEKYPKIASAHFNNSGWNRLTKQILAHQFIIDTLPTSYDVIVRMRYDSWVGEFQDWKGFLQKCFDENVVISFGGWSGEMDKRENICNELIDASNISKLDKALTDFLNIHPQYKMSGAKELHFKEELFPSNQGWYQVLVDPYLEPHFNYGGGVMLTRYRK